MIPFEEIDFVNHPVSLYVATKKSNESMTHTIVICMTFRQRACAFSPYMDQWGDRTWLILRLRISFLLVSQFIFLITAILKTIYTVILNISMTLLETSNA